LIALLGAIALICWQSSQIHKWHENATHCGEARVADRTSYEQAQKTAEALNKAHVERVKSQQQRITDDVEANLSARLERLRRELSQGGTTAPQSHPASPAAGNAGTTSQGPAGAPRLCLSTEELLRAAENEERHDQLINWEVDPNK
jgi:hypothetical protein